MLVPTPGRWIVGIGSASDLTLRIWAMAPMPTATSKRTTQRFMIPTDAEPYYEAEHAEGHMKIVGNELTATVPSGGGPHRMSWMHGIGEDHRLIGG